MTDDWFDSALKRYVDEKFKAQDAVDVKAQDALDYRLDSMNEFREQIIEERGQFLQRNVYEQRYAALEARIDGLDVRADRRLSGLERWQSKIVGALALVIFMVPLLIGILSWVVKSHHGP